MDDQRGAAGSITRRQAEAAYERIRKHIRETPIVALGAHEAFVDCEIIFKLELMQHSGSFKCRGAFNSLLSGVMPKSGVIAASGGNHGAAVAYAASRLGCPAEIFVPATSSPVKIERIRQYGATLQIGGQSYADALEASIARARNTGAKNVHAYDQPETIAGQATLGLEFERQAGSLDTILVSVGGGGLLGGLLVWYGRRARVIGVEPRLAPSLTKALEAGEPVDVEVSGVAADSLGARRCGRIAFELARAFLDRMILVEDDEIVAAQRFLWSDLRVLAEPGAVAALSALTSRRYVPQPGERVGVVISGGNADPAKFSPG